MINKRSNQWGFERIGEDFIFCPDCKFQGLRKNHNCIKPKSEVEQT